MQKKKYKAPKINTFANRNPLHYNMPALKKPDMYEAIDKLQKLIFLKKYLLAEKITPVDDLDHDLIIKAIDEEIPHYRMDALTYFECGSRICFFRETTAEDCIDIEDCIVHGNALEEKE